MYMHLNRSKNCHLCNSRGVRIHLAAPTEDDPDYVLAVCPTCDLITENEKEVELRNDD